MPRQHEGPPDLGTLHGRLRWARTVKGKYESARSAAAANGWNENAYKSHEYGVRGKDGLKTKTAEKYARAFKVDTAWLLTGKGSPDRDELDELSAEDRAVALRLVKATKPG